MRKHSGDLFLEEALAIAKRIREPSRRNRESLVAVVKAKARRKREDDVQRLALLVRALDGWITNSETISCFPERWRPRIEVGKKRRKR